MTRKQDLFDRKPLRKEKEEDQEIKIDKDEDWKGEGVIRTSSKQRKGDVPRLQNRSSKWG
ncbi:hypothetical protein [Ruegeria sp. HKCCD8929]|uniref:hypothetical protein n=1 Tax=Ruegeria sp. HKCCD8929 TaxID=2683006 RepID=UPI001488A005|nr:hypothetical protein [Ruegeria sp. HKCCD8929]